MLEYLMFVSLLNNYNVQNNAIVVLGYGLESDDFNNVAEKRVIKAINLTNEKTNNIIFSGGHHNGNIFRKRIEDSNYEAFEMYKIYIKLANNSRRPSSFDCQSLNTLQNAYNTLQICKQKKITNLLVVSTNHKHAKFYFWLIKILTNSRVKLQFDIE